MKTTLTALALVTLAGCSAANSNSSSDVASVQPQFETVTTCLTTDFHTSNLPIMHWDIRQSGNQYAVKIVRSVGADSGAIDHITAVGSIADQNIALSFSDGSSLSASVPAGTPVGSFLPGTFTPTDGSATRQVSCDTDQEGPVGPDRVWFLSFSTNGGVESIDLADGSYSAALVQSIPLETGACEKVASPDTGVAYSCSGDAYSTMLTADAAQSKGTAVVTEKASGKQYTFQCARAHNFSIMHPGLLPAGDFDCGEAGN